MGNFAAAAQMLGYADARYAAADDMRQANEARMAQLATTAIDAALGQAEHVCLRDVGAPLTIDQARALQQQVLADASDAR
ncbi:MAG: hypothetical protein ABI593_00535 [Betaproteobacteria bacterium]